MGPSAGAPTGAMILGTLPRRAGSAATSSNRPRHALRRRRHGHRDDHRARFRVLLLGSAATPVALFLGLIIHRMSATGVAALPAKRELQPWINYNVDKRTASPPSPGDMTQPHDERPERSLDHGLLPAHSKTAAERTTRSRASIVTSAKARLPSPAPTWKCFWGADHVRCREG